MSRNLVTLGILCLFATVVLAADPVGVTGEAIRTESPKTGIDVEIAHQESAPSWKAREQLLGDLGGFRTMLARHGMSLEISSLDEGFGSPGDDFEASEDSRYHGLTDIVFSIDTAGAGWWKGGTFVVDLQNARGGDISDVVGDVQGVSNIVAPPGTRFAEYYLDQLFGNGRFRVKVGKQDANADFVVSHGGGEFINSSFGLIPTVPLPTFPAPALGVMAGWSPSDAVHIKAGYWDGAPIIGSGVSPAIFDGSNGTVGAAGIEITPFGDRIIEGTYRVGIWRHSEVEVAPPVAKAAIDPTLTGPAEGVYFTVDQGIWESGDRRLSVFLQGGWGEADRSAVGRYFGGGLTFRSPFSTRSAHLLGIGVAHAEIGELGRTEGLAGSETVVELFYKVPVLGWMTLNPDLQWVHRPGGTNDAVFVAGLRVATSF
jgi:porin